MMGNVVNLKLVKKRNARTAREANAGANRAKFGQTKAEKQKAKAEAKLTTRILDGHQRSE